MTARVLRRVLAMDGAEVRFRTASVARRLIERTATLAAPPRWRREELHARLKEPGSSLFSQARRALRRKDWFAAHELLAHHFATRLAAFPANAVALDRVAREIQQRFPDATAEARERARRIASGRYDLLGYSNVPYGVDPDWHLDAISGRRAPPDFWADVPYLDPALGDHKLTWELNRHQHWLQLGRAFRLTGDRAYYDRFVGELESWITANPPLTGTNWASMLELAFRSLSWLWALHFFSPAANTRDRFPWLVDLLLALERQLDHVKHNLSRYFSPNTHLTGEALALYVAGQALPELRKAGRFVILGRRILLEESNNQIAPDGGHRELSGHYHRYSTDFYLLAALVAARCGDDSAPALERTARRQAAYLRSICDDRGRRPSTGDDDGGQLFPICGRPSDDCRDTLSSAAVLLGDPALAIDGLAEETCWVRGEVPDLDVKRARWPSVVLPDTGYCVSRTAQSDHLLFDAGPHGFRNGGHAHADALAVILTVRGKPLLIDPGTATYTMDRAVRDRFRTTAMHNTLVLNGRPQSQPADPFHWTSQATGRLTLATVADGCDYFEGAHDGYLPSTHTRAVLAVHDVCWCLVDFVFSDSPLTADAHWHLHPMWRPEPLSPCVVALVHGDTNVQVVSSSPLAVLGPDEIRGLSDVSLAYGRIEPSHTLRAPLQGPAPLALLTYVDPASEAGRAATVERLDLTHEPGPGWYGCGFRIVTAAATVVLLAATQRSDRSLAAKSPGSIWGCDQLLTDGRAACTITHRTGRAEAVVVEGARIEARGGAAISGGARSQLIRTAVAQLA